MEFRDHFLVFSFDENEIVPCFIGFGHNLKEEYLCRCKTISKTANENIVTYKKNAICKDKNIDMYLTFQWKKPFLELLHGKVVVDNDAEYKVYDYKSYNSLQIEQYCYDSISVIKLKNNFFTMNRQDNTDNPDSPDNTNNTKFPFSISSNTTTNGTTVDTSF